MNGEKREQMYRGKHSVVTARLLLRPFEAEDVAAYAAIRAKPEVVRYLPGGEETAINARAIAERTVTAFADLWVGEPGYGPWAVVEKSSGALVGHLGLRLLPELSNETEILYMLDSEVWGRGYQTRAAVETYLDAAGVTPQRVTTFNTFAAILHAVSLRGHSAIVPADLGRVDGLSNLRFIALSPAPAERVICLLTGSEARRTPASDQMARRIRAVFEQA